MIKRLCCDVNDKCELPAVWARDSSKEGGKERKGEGLGRAAAPALSEIHAWLRDVNGRSCSGSFSFGLQPPEFQFQFQFQLQFTSPYCKKVNLV